MYLASGRLAQLVEHSLDVRRVSGSSPLSSTKKRNHPRDGFFFWCMYFGKKYCAVRRQTAAAKRQRAKPVCVSRHGMPHGAAKLRSIPLSSVLSQKPSERMVSFLVHVFRQEMLRGSKADRCREVAKGEARLRKQTRYASRSSEAAKYTVIVSNTIQPSERMVPFL